MATLRDDDHGLRTRLLLGELKIRGQHDDYDILSAATFGMVHDVQRSQPLRRVLSEKTGIERAGIQIRCRLKGAKGQRIATQFPQNPQYAASAQDIEGDHDWRPSFSAPECVEMPSGTTSP